MVAHFSVVRGSGERKRNRRTGRPPSATTGDKLWETADALAVVRSRCYDRIGLAPSYRPDTKYCSRDSPHSRCRKRRVRPR